MRRYPLSLLVEAAGCSEAALGRRVGLSGTTLKNARLTGFTEQAADRYAVRAELHPVEVWGHGFGLPVCESPSCGQPFVPGQKSQRFCSRLCCDRERKRRLRRHRYHTDPAFADALRAARRDFYKQCRDYERARQRNYDRTVSAVRRAGKKGDVENVRNKQIGVEFPITTSVDRKPIKKGLIAS